MKIKFQQAMFPLVHMGEWLLILLVIIMAETKVTVYGKKFLPLLGLPSWINCLFFVAIGIWMLGSLFHIPFKSTLGSQFKIPRVKASLLIGILLLFLAGDYGYNWLWHRHMPQPHWMWHWNNVGSVILEAVVFAFAEEWLFRGHLFARWERISTRQFHFLGFPFSAAVIATSTAFALIHLVKGPLGLFTFFPGLFFGITREKTGNIFIPALVHAIFNLWTYQLT